MNFKEHYIIAEETVNSDTFDYLIKIKFYEPAFDKLKAKKGYTSMVKGEKEKIFYSASQALNNYPFNGKSGAYDDNRMSIGSDTSEFPREDLPYLDIYVKGVKIDSEVIQDLYDQLRQIRPHLIGTITYEDLLRRGLKKDAKEAWNDILY
jgi:hypothetical protein